MAAPSSSALALLTAFFSAEHIEAAARQTGFVQRTLKMTGSILLALVTFGVWRDAKTMLAQVAAKAAPWSQHVAVSPAAIDQRMNQRALALLQDLICPTLAKRHACQPGCDESLLAPCARVHMADSTGFELPDSLKDTFPRAGGSAAPAGANLQRVWDDHQSVCTHLALLPWNVPEQKYLATVVAFAQP
jgi:hypothetical protein